MGWGGVGFESGGCCYSCAVGVFAFRSLPVVVVVFFRIFWGFGICTYFSWCDTRL